MNTFTVLAEAFTYPKPGLLEELERHVADWPPGGIRMELERFLAAIRPLPLSTWEELYTRTWDLNPLVAPYLGFHRWGESYARGDFMAQLNAAYRRWQIPTDGELPDHLIPVFRYLATTEEVLPQLQEVLPFALQAMHKALREADRDNPYLHLLEAAREAVTVWAKQVSGG